MINRLPLQGVKACVFDAYGTLFDVHAAASQHRQHLGEVTEAFSATWRQKQLQYTWLRSLMDDHKDFWQVTQDALDYALATFPEVSPAVRQPLLETYWHLDAYAEAPATLHALKERGFNTAILSNGEMKMLAAAVTHAGLSPLLDAVLSADAAGVFKPDARVYALAPEYFKCVPHDILFMSANAWDVSGAAHYGFKVVWVNRFNAAPEQLSGAYVADIPSLKELLL